MRRSAGPTWATLGVLALLLLFGGAEARASQPDPLFDDPEGAEVPSGFPDPFEPINRAVFGFNQQVDRFVLAPLDHAYVAAVPEGGRRAVRRALANLDAPVVFVNDLLQLDPGRAIVTLTRFGVNTTLGVLGFFDVAAVMGIEGHRTDFAETMALVGIPSGPFLVLPVLGPTTARDGTGFLVDLAFQPITYLLTPAVVIVLTAAREGGAGFASYDENAGALRALRESSVDFYAAVRNAYYQNAMGQIGSRRAAQQRDAAAPAWRTSLLGALTFAPARGEIRDLAPQSRY
ncbi:MAG: VacJ family lipoprotein [bacterium]|nr:VacJ family lipoprotein [bacterium]